VLARRAGSKWYVACINGENTERTVSVDLSVFKKHKASIITDGTEPLTFTSENIKSNSKKQFTVKPQGGFVMVLE
jgi:hypothetical protein